MNLFFYSLKFISVIFSLESTISWLKTKNLLNSNCTGNVILVTFERCCILFTTLKFSLNFARTLYMNLSLMLSRIKLISTSFCACI